MGTGAAIFLLDFSAFSCSSLCCSAFSCSSFCCSAFSRSSLCCSTFWISGESSGISLKEGIERDGGEFAVILGLSVGFSVCFCAIAGGGLDKRGLNCA